MGRLAQAAQQDPCAAVLINLNLDVQSPMGHVCRRSMFRGHRLVTHSMIFSKLPLSLPMFAE